MRDRGLARDIPCHVDRIQDGLALLVAHFVAVAAPGAVWHVVGQLPLSQDGCALKLEQDIIRLVYYII